MMAKILVVEDERIVAKDIQRCLVQRGHDVPVIASSVDEAMTAAERIRPDLVLMDVTLRAPLDGIECAANLRDRLQIPVVYLTANGDESTLELAGRTGPVGYVLKPFQEQTLFAAVEVALQRIAIDAQLRRRESWLSAVLGSIVDGVVTIGSDGCVTLLNPAGSAMTGISKDEAVGRPFEDVVRIDGEKDGLKLRTLIGDMLSRGSGSGAPFACTLLGERDAVIPVECSVTPLHGTPGPSAGAVVVIRNVSERLRAEAALTSSEERYRRLFENAVEGVFRSSTDGALVSCNPAMAQLLGYESFDEIRSNGGINLRDVYLNPARRDEMVKRLKTEGMTKQFEAMYRRRDGSEGWFSANLRGIKDGAGHMTDIEGTVMDITDRKDAGEDLLRREAYLRAILDSAPYVIWLKDTQGRYIDLNKKLAQVTGNESIDDLRGKTDFEIYPHDEAARLRNNDFEVMKGENLLVVDEGIDKEGKKHHIEKYKSVLKDATGKVIGTVGFAQDITETREREVKLRKLSRAVEQSPSTIVITDTSGRIEYVNPRFCVLTGYSAEEVIGKTPRLLKSGRTPREVYEKLWGAITSGGEWSGELLNRKKNGELFWEYASISPIRDEKGVITHFIGIKEDITKRKESEAELARRAADLLKAKSWAEQQARRLGVQAFELRKAREEALRASRMKSEFVANMSHEIRTPMNGVLGMTGLLLDTVLDAEQREYAEIIRTSGEALLSLVNDILDFSKIEAGKLELEDIEFFVRNTLEESLDLVSARAREKGLELCCFVADGVPPDLKGDPGRVRQILTNLLSNAVKFTEQGEVEARVTCEHRGAASVRLRFSIRDTGIGISDEERQKLFKSFSQADGSTTRKYGGTGLGLVIAKQLVELMGGEIGVSSEKGKGSEFWFTVSLATAPPSPAKPRSAALAGVRVLVVDDNATSRKILLHHLGAWGMRPEAVASGEEALAVLRRESSSADRFRVALLDMQMPGMDGLHLAARVMADPDLRSVRLMLLSSAGPESVRQGREIGLATCLTKPIRDSLLHRSLVQILSSVGVAGVMDLPEASRESSGSAGPRGQKRRLKRVLVAEDNPVNQRVAVKMLEKIGCRADVVANGKEALDAVGRIPYDVVFMDCQMPEMDGFEATAQIRKLDGGAGRALIIAMTANALQGDRERCIAVGMNDYLSKPVTQEALAAVLGKWESLISAPGEIPPGIQTTDAPEPEEDFEVDKIAELKELAAGGGPLWLETLIRQFVTDSSGRLEKIRAAMLSGEAGEFAEAAHALKGSSATMGAAQMKRIAERLQVMGRSGSLGGAEPLLEELEREIASAAGYLQVVLAGQEVQR
jgi:two-component system sensor histidine kinase/response regulator